MSLRLTPRTRRLGVALTATGALLGMLMMVTAVPTVASPSQNTNCSDQGFDYGIKVEDPSGTAILDDGYLKATVTVGTFADVNDPNPHNAITSYGYLDGNQATVGMIIVKGGQNAYNTYDWGDATPLHAPANDNGKWPTISHYDFCYNLVEVPETGELLLTKAVIGEAPEGAEYDVTITGPLPSEGTRSGVLLPGGTVLFTKLEPGDYLISELDPADGSVATIVPETVTVVAGEQAEAVVTNTYEEEEPELGSVLVSKVVAGPEVEGAEYRIVLTGPDGEDTTYEITLAGGESGTLTDLPVGTYDVSEPDAGTGVTVTIDPSAVVVIGDETAEVTVTNTYDEVQPPVDVVGKASITKNVVGPAPDGAEFEIVLTGPDGATTTHSVTLTAGQTVLLTDLPFGAYTVTEPNPGAGVTVSMDHPTIHVTNGLIAPVVVTNTYAEDEVLPPETPETPETPLPTAGRGTFLALLATVLLLTGSCLVLVSREPEPVTR